MSLLHDLSCRFNTVVFLWICLLVVATHSINAQAPPSTGWEPLSPVNHPLRLSGTFGELRSGHFHMGIDIKSSNGTWGDPVYAIDTGHVSRISISPGGYGLALYIDHPSGITSVYAHLQNFSKEIEAVSIQAQKKAESYHIDLPISPGILPVARGQQIGNMGSTGFSFGPHLHFELRSIRSETAINPLHFGFKVPDEDAPVIHKVKIFRLDYQYMPYADTVFAQPLQHLSGDTLTIDAWRIGLGLECYDYFNNSRNKNGWYQLSLRVDDEDMIHTSMDSINWSDGRHYNMLIDQADLKTSGSKTFRCYRLPTMQLQSDKRISNHGIINLYKDQLRKITLTVKDMAGKSEEITFWARRSDEITPPTYPVFQFKALPNEPSLIQQEEVVCKIPENALYHTLYANFRITAPESPWIGKTIQIGDPLIPLRSPIDLQFPVADLNDTLRSRTFLVHLNHDNKAIQIPTIWSGDTLRASPEMLGTFTVAMDTLPPEITLIHAKVEQGSRILTFKIDDNFANRMGHHLGLNYTATWNNSWVMGSYDLKQKRVVFQLPGIESTSGEHVFHFVVKDFVGNERKYVTRYNN